MLSNWKHVLKLVSYLLLASVTAANAQVHSSVSESVLSKVIGSTGGFIEIAGRVRVAFSAKFFAKPETVTIRISAALTTATARAGYELWGAGGPYLSFDVLVEAKQEPQADYGMTITLPADYLRQIASNLGSTGISVDTYPVSRRRTESLF
jgi:hypothetical protein